MNDEEHDHDGMYVAEIPCWRFSLWDVAGITAHTTMGLLVALGNGFGLIARECQAMANNSRQTFDLRQAERAHREAQAAIGADLARMIAVDRPEEES